MQKLIVILALLTVLLPVVVSAQSIPDASELPTGKRPNSFHVFGAFAAGFNPITFGSQIKPYLKMPWGEGKTLLTSDSHWRLGGNFTLSPAYCRPGLMIGVSPLLILDLDFVYGPGIDISHYVYDSYDDSYDPMNLGETTGDLGYFHQFSINAQLKAAVGPIAMLSMNDGEYLQSDEFYFNWENAAIFKTGYLFRSKTFLLWEYAKNQRMFVNYEYLQYYPTSFETQLLGFGVFLADKLPYNMSWMFQTGYHIEHPKFTGIKFWTAIMRDWDFPLAKKQ